MAWNGIELDSDRLRGSRLVFEKMCYLSVVSFMSRVSNIKNVVNSGTWTQRNCCCCCFFHFLQKMCSHWCACMWLYHFCFGCKNVYVMKYFQFFVLCECVCIMRKSEWTNSKAQLAWNAWNWSEWWAMSCARTQTQTYTHAHAVIHACMLYDATNIHSFIHSFPSTHTFRTSSTNDRKKYVSKPSINYDWQPVDLKTRSLIK